jgi:hypothetical protein
VDVDSFYKRLVVSFIIFTAPVSPEYFGYAPVIVNTLHKVINIIIIIIIIIPGNHDVRELQKTAILGTAHILRKVLM